MDEARPPIEQNGRRWQFLAGLSAVSVEANVPGEDLGQLSGYKIVPSSEVPEGVESFSLVKREDNGLVGIFTGVIRAVGERGTAGSFQSECPVQVKEAYPELKSYLLKASSEAELQECFQCLSNLQRFRSLDWEILDHPRTNR